MEVQSIGEGYCAPEQSVKYPEVQVCAPFLHIPILFNETGPQSKFAAQTQFSFI